MLFIGLFLSLSVFAQKKGNMAEMAEHDFRDLDGNVLPLTVVFELHKGKVIYVDFWASWCGPCKRQMPASKELHAMLEEEGKDVVFVYLSLDEDEEAWINSVDKLELEGDGIYHYQRGSEAAKNLLRLSYIYSIPHYWIIDKEGNFADLDAFAPMEKGVYEKLVKVVDK